MSADDGSKAAIKVSLATPDDIPELIPIFWEAFSGPAESTFPHTDGGRKWLERSFENFVGKPSHYRPESKVPVVRNANGRPLSFAIVHIVKPGQTAVGGSWKRRWSSTDDLPDVSEEHLASFFECLAKAHQLTMGKEGHVCIEFLMTKSTSRHKGYATALVDWVAKLADDLGYACYLDGGGRGMEMLEHAGFVAKDIGLKYGDIPPCVPMVRPTKEA
ncbi:hypothetical protein ONZ43_g3820 [Nemania bipapillata]|uniref:Uncharacterized protein n=1 Tax=Nemania bipapillata TaxID=110536 RepID=A0ACC2IVK4_9PEZI|nr:hypothetical protein ONZ43_g3820 [Nemania bipapillata]